MRTNYKSDDELIFSLPEYVSGEELECGIREKIEERLKNDASFYTEYLKIKETYEFMKDVETDKAPDNYFSSLLPRIHEKIESRAPGKNLLHYLIGSWKIAVPALTVILLIMIFNKSDKVEHINGIPEIRQDAVTMPADSNIKESTGVSANTEVSTDTKVISGTEKNALNTETAQSTVKQKTVKSVKEENASVLSESIFSESEEEDEFYYEDEFSSMNASEQIELINNLKNTKF